MGSELRAIEGLFATGMLSLYPIVLQSPFVINCTAIPFFWHELITVIALIKLSEPLNLRCAPIQGRENSGTRGMQGVGSLWW